MKVITITNSKGGSGKCLAGETRVIDMASGRPREIASAPPRTTWALEPESISLREVFVAAKHGNGQRSTVHLKLASGRSVRCTPDHPFLTVDGWRPLNEVPLGASIATAAWTPFATQPKRMLDPEVDLLAILMAEGGTSGPATRFSSLDPVIIELATAGAKSLGCSVADVDGVSYSIARREDLDDIPDGLCGCGCGARTTRTRSSHPTTRGYIRKGDHHRYLVGHNGRSEALASFRIRHGLDGVLAKHKKMPAAVWSLPKDQLARFITVFWMCDGFVSPQPAVTLASEQLVLDLQALLLRFGVRSRVKAKINRRDGKAFDAWHLSILSDSYEAFSNFTDLWGHKRENLEALTRLPRNPNTGHPVASEGLRRFLRGRTDQPRTHGGSPSFKGVAARLGWGQFQYDLLYNGERVSLRALHACAEEFGFSEHVADILCPDIWWDDVVSVEDAGTTEVFDLEVPGVENFVLDNGVIVHNSTSAMLLAWSARQAGRPVLVVDTDVTAAAHAWHRAALLKGFKDCELRVVVKPDGDSLVDTIVLHGSWASEDRLVVIIDTPPGVHPVVSEALALSDLAIVPVSPTAIEFAQLPGTLARIEALKVPAVVLPVKVRSGTNSAKELDEALGDIPTTRHRVSLSEEIAQAASGTPTSVKSYNIIWKELEAAWADETKEEQP